MGFLVWKIFPSSLVATLQGVGVEGYEGGGCSLSSDRSNQFRVPFVGQYDEFCVLRREVCGQCLGIQNPLMLDSDATRGDEEFILGELAFSPYIELNTEEEVTVSARMPALNAEAPIGLHKPQAIFSCGHSCEWADCPSCPLVPGITLSSARCHTEQDGEHLKHVLGDVLECHSARWANWKCWGNLAAIIDREVEFVTCPYAKPLEGVQDVIGSGWLPALTSDGGLTVVLCSANHVARQIGFDQVHWSPVTRWASVAFGAGVGIGSAYTECSYKFDGSPARLTTTKISDTPASPLSVSSQRKATLKEVASVHSVAWKHRYRYGIRSQRLSLSSFSLVVDLIIKEPSLNRFRQSFSQLLPCRLGRKKTSGTQLLPCRLGRKKTSGTGKHPHAIVERLWRTTLSCQELRRRREEGSWAMLRGLPWVPSGKGLGSQIPTADMRVMALQMEEMRQILVANNIKLLANRVDEALSEVRALGRDVVAQGNPKGKRACSCHDEVESHGQASSEGSCCGEIDYRSKVVRGLRSVHVEQLLPWYQTPFTLEIEGMKPPEKFKLEIARQPLSINDGDVEPPQRAHVQARFIINTKPPKGIEEFVVVSYKLGLTLREKLFDDLTLDPTTKLPDLMARVEKYARLEDDSNLQCAKERASRRKLDQATQGECGGAEKTKSEETEVQANSRFDRGRDEAEDPMEDDFPIGTINMIGGPHMTPSLKIGCRGRFRLSNKCMGPLSQQAAKKPKQSSPEPGSITFTRADLERVQHPHNDPLVIQLQIHNYNVEMILVDSSCSVEVTYYDLFKQLNLTWADLKLVRALLVGFNAQVYWPPLNSDSKSELVPKSRKLSSL
ncbi:MICOS complex subunit, putative [Actinidia rufa]|uniref:MICOS complex subunit, putative n=1 Tax=Actinidia rufa TaxID=165716 RepID=A0A7J0FDW7_9ERIC|nr:MICOS complex subunit, putative [Actinidia rufa]